VSTFATTGSTEVDSGGDFGGGGDDDFGGGGDDDFGGGDDDF